MKLLLDVEDNKANSLLDVLSGLRFVKTKTLSSYKANVLLNIKNSVDEMNLVKKKKLKARNVQLLINEL